MRDNQLWPFSIQTRWFSALRSNVRFSQERSFATASSSTPTGAFIGSEVLDRERGEFVKFTISDQF